MIERTLEERQHKIEETKSELVDMKPEFAAALEKCISFSNSKSPPLITLPLPYSFILIIDIGSRGKSAFLLKSNAKRRRTR